MMLLFRFLNFQVMERVSRWKNHCWWGTLTHAGLRRPCPLEQMARWIQILSQNHPKKCWSLLGKAMVLGFGALVLKCSECTCQLQGKPGAEVDVPPGIAGLCRLIHGIPVTELQGTQTSSYHGSRVGVFKLYPCRVSGLEMLDTITSIYAVIAIDPLG